MMVGGVFGADMAQQVIDWRDTGGFIPRVRYAVGNNDAFDYTLGNEKISFDSEWPEIISVHSGSYNATFSQDSSAGNFKIMSTTFSELPYSPLAVAWRRNPTANFPIYINSGGDNWNALTSHVVSPAYRSVPCATTGAKLTIQDQSSYAGSNYAYLVLANSLVYDAREDNAAVVQRILCGNHPTRGIGFYVSRKGANVLTCPDYDLKINSNKMSFQIEASGSLTASQTVVDKVSNINIWGFLEKVTLGKAYPTRPPIFISWYTLGLRPGADTFAQVGWLNDSEIVIRIYGNSVRDNALAANIRYWIPSYQPDYSGADTASVCRIIGTSSGMRISKHDVDAVTAPSDSLLFNSDRSMVHIFARLSSNGIGAGTLSYSSKATGPPLIIISSYFNGRSQQSVNQAPGIFVLNNSNIGWSGSPSTFTAAVIDFSKYT